MKNLLRFGTGLFALGLLFVGADSASAQNRGNRNVENTAMKCVMPAAIIVKKSVKRVVNTAMILETETTVGKPDANIATKSETRAANIVTKEEMPAVIIAVIRVAA